MAKGLNALVIAPMGKKDKEEEPEEDSSDGLRLSFDEYMDAVEAGDRDAAFEAFKALVEMCSYHE
jgi:hypothetical protein